MATEFASLCLDDLKLTLGGFWSVLFWVVGLWLDTKELGWFLCMEAGLDCLSMGGFCLVLTGGWVVNWVVDFLVG